MNATAFVVGASNGSGATLLDLAKQLGFAAVHAFSNMRALDRHAEKTPLMFFLFAPVEDVKALKRVANSVRTHQQDRVRFAPMVYFADAPSLSTIRECVDMGFDDVITLPFSAQRVEERLRRQLDVALPYFETQTYFGPDRRGRLPPEHDHHHLRGKGGEHRYFEVTRTLAGGIAVVGDDMQFIL